MLQRCCCLRLSGGLSCRCRSELHRFNKSIIEGSIGGFSKGEMGYFFVFHPGVRISQRFGRLKPHRIAGRRPPFAARPPSGALHMAGADGPGCQDPVHHHHDERRRRTRRRAPVGLSHQHSGIWQLGALSCASASAGLRAPDASRRIDGDAKSRWDAPPRSRHTHTCVSFMF